jgi:hypothetical protein
MTGSHTGSESEIRVELKYCERCGGLGVRETDSGQIYCLDCQDKVAELPLSRRGAAHRLALGPVTWSHEYNEQDEYNLEISDCDDLDARAGVAV